MPEQRLMVGGGQPTPSRKRRAAADTTPAPIGTLSSPGASAHSGTKERTPAPAAVGDPTRTPKRQRSGAPGAPVPNTPKRPPSGQHVPPAPGVLNTPTNRSNRPPSATPAPSPASSHLPSNDAPRNMPRITAMLRDNVSLFSRDPGTGWGLVGYGNTDTNIPSQQPAPMPNLQPTAPMPNGQHTALTLNPQYPAPMPNPEYPPPPMPTVVYKPDPLPPRAKSGAWVTKSIPTMDEPVTFDRGDSPPTTATGLTKQEPVTLNSTCGTAAANTGVFCPNLPPAAPAMNTVAIKHEPATPNPQHPPATINLAATLPAPIMDTSVVKHDPSVLNPPHSDPATNLSVSKQEPSTPTRKRPAHSSDGDKSKKSRTVHSSNDGEETFTVEDFWKTIEDAWAKVDWSVNAGRKALVTSLPFIWENFHIVDALFLGFDLVEMLRHLTSHLRNRSAHQIEMWTSHMTQALYDIDSERAHRALGGNAETFKRRRAYIVSLGQAYYEAFKNDPRTYGRRDTCPGLLHLGPMVYKLKGDGKDMTPPLGGVSCESFTHEDCYSKDYNPVAFIDNEDDSEDAGVVDDFRRVIAEAKLCNDATMSIDVFWASIEIAWTGLDPYGCRSNLAAPHRDAVDRQMAADQLDVSEMVFNLRAVLKQYTHSQLGAWKMHLDTLLYGLDRHDCFHCLKVTANTFVGCRCFIVACGKAYYDAVQSDFQRYLTMRYTMDLSSLAADVARAKFGPGYMRNDEIDISTGSNRDMYPPNTVVSPASVNGLTPVSLDSRVSPVSS